MDEPTVPAPPEFDCRYVCGGCDYDEVGPWGQHQLHYEAHLEEGWHEDV